MLPATVNPLRYHLISSLAPCAPRITLDHKAHYPININLPCHTRVRHNHNWWYVNYNLCKNLLSPERAASRRNFRKRRLNADANATIHALRHCTFRRDLSVCTRVPSLSIRYIGYRHELNPITHAFSAKQQNILFNRMAKKLKARRCGTTELARTFSFYIKLFSAGKHKNDLNTVYLNHQRWKQTKAAAEETKFVHFLKFGNAHIIS